jgi:hypothetical protein
MILANMSQQSRTGDKLRRANRHRASVREMIARKLRPREHKMSARGLEFLLNLLSSMCMFSDVSCVLYEGADCGRS